MAESFIGRRLRLRSQFDLGSTGSGHWFQSKQQRQQGDCNNLASDVVCSWFLDKTQDWAKVVKCSDCGLSVDYENMDGADFTHIRLSK